VASGLYVSGTNAIMGSLDLENDDVSALLIDLDEYTPDLDVHTTQEDIPTAAVLSEAALTGKTIASEIFRASDTTFLSVTGTAGGVVLIKDADSYPASTLISWHEFDEEIEADGEDVVSQWDDTDGIINFATEVE
jgi:hypothetical protein